MLLFGGQRLDMTEMSLNGTLTTALKLSTALTGIATAINISLTLEASRRLPTACYIVNVKSQSFFLPLSFYRLSL